MTLSQDLVLFQPDRQYDWDFIYIMNFLAHTLSYGVWERE